MPVPVFTIPPSTDEVIVGGARAVNLNDADYPDEALTGGHGERIEPYDVQDGGYVGPDERIINDPSGMLPSYEFANPAPGQPGSTDRVNAQSVGGVTGTALQNYKNGPVTGYAMDADRPVQTQQIGHLPPGQHGPIVGGDDYSAVVAAAAFQQAFDQYSTAPSDQAIVGAI